MSLKTIPGFGKSGMSRMWSLNSMSPFAGSRGQAAEVPDEKQVLQVGGNRRQVLERLDRLLAALGIARAQRRREDLLEQCRLAIRRGPEDAQVAAADAEAGELADCADDLELRVVVPGLALALLALDHAVLLELADKRALRPRLVAHLFEAEVRAD